MKLALALLVLCAACGDDDGGAGADAAMTPDGPPSSDGPAGPDATVDAMPAPDVPSNACGGAPFSALTPGTPVTGATAGPTSATEGTCGGMTAGDAFYTLDVLERADVILSTDHPGTDYNAVVYLRSACLDAASELGCAGTGPLGDTLVVRDAAPGTYFVVLDGVAGMEGSYELSVSLRPVRDTGQACDPAGIADRCEDGTQCLDAGTGPRCSDPFTFACMGSTAAAAGTVLTGTIAGSSALAPTCGAGAGEAIYHIDLAVPGFLRAVEQGTGLAAGSTLYARGPASCSPDDDLACDDLPGGLSLLSGPLAAGRYYLVIDGSGAYQVALDVGQSLAGGEACDPASVTARCGIGLYCLSATCQPVTFVDDTSPNAAFCDAQGPFSGDVVVDASLTTGGATDLDNFELQLAAPAVLRVETSDGLAGCAVDTLVEVFAKGSGDCFDLDFGSPAPIAMDDDSGAPGGCSLLTTASLAAGNYYVRIRRGGTTSGPYTLLVDVQ
jgi:hypothetical protein